LQFLEAVAGWIGQVGRRAELAEQATLTAFVAGRGTAVQELLGILTPRQQEVANLVAAGLTNREIGSRLFITAGSVANHIGRIFQQLDFSRRSQIAAWMVQHGMAESPDPDCERADPDDPKPPPAPVVVSIVGGQPN
jgi:DNA-binding CsgD family transcriptional regulator